MRGTRQRLTQKRTDVLWVQTQQEVVSFLEVLLVVEWEAVDHVDGVLDVLLLERIDQIEKAGFLDVLADIISPNL